VLRDYARSEVLEYVSSRAAWAALRAVKRLGRGADGGCNARRADAGPAAACFPPYRGPIRGRLSARTVKGPRQCTRHGALVVLENHYLPG
jgi:hypothetical protein